MTDHNNSKKPATVELRADVDSSGSGGGGSDWNPKKIGIIAGIVILVIVLIGLAWAAFGPNQGGGGDGADGEKGDGIFGSLPGALDSLQKPTVSGLSGMPCEHPDRRPIGVMLAGDPINRPMSGFSQADMVWELPVLTSNVTRLLAVYQCGQPEDIGSIRSARHDYLFLAEGIDAIVAHWGGSYHALNRIDAGEFNTINALVNPFNAFFRKDHLPAPYNGFSTYERLWNALQQLEYRQTTEFKGYEFKDDAPAEERPAGGTLSVAWPGQFSVHYEYDPETNRYVRFWAGTKQVDAADDQTVAPSAVVIMRASNEFAEGPGGYNDVGIEGSGEMEVHQDGKVIRGTWTKSEIERTDPVHFLDENGNEITFTRGQVWVMAPSSNIDVTWEPVTETTEDLPAAPANQ